MTPHTFILNSDVDAVTIRRMSEGAGANWLVTLTASWPSLKLADGRLACATQPHGLGSSPDFATAMTKAQNDLLAEIDKARVLAESKPLVTYPQRGLTSDAEDLFKLLDL